MVLMLFFALPSALAGGSDGIDFIYYSVNSTDSSVELADGVNLSAWDTTNALGTRVARLSVSANTSDASYVWPADCFGVVVEGTVTLMGSAMEVGDMDWIAAGAIVGPLSGPGVVTLVCDGIKPFSLQKGTEAAYTTDAIVSSITSLSFRANTTTNTLPDGYRYSYPGDFALADLVNWTAGCGFPPHYHPRGSFYILIEGSLTYGGDRDDYVRLYPGDIRWVRPGWYYTAEFTTEDSRFLALHTSVSHLDTSAASDLDFVVWDLPPCGLPFVVQFQTTTTTWFEPQEAAIDLDQEMSPTNS